MSPEPETTEEILTRLETDLKQLRESIARRRAEEQAAAKEKADAEKTSQAPQAQQELGKREILVGGKVPPEEIEQHDAPGAWYPQKGQNGGEYARVEDLRPRLQQELNEPDREYRDDNYSYVSWTGFDGSTFVSRYLHREPDAERRRF